MMKTKHLKNYLSKIFQPITAVQKEANLSKQEITSKSQRLMLELGIIQQANPGCFHLLPLGLRSLDKLIKLIDHELQNIGGQKLILPTLVNKSLWKTTGRLNENQSELFQLNDRHHHEYLLCPTQEETITSLLAMNAPITYKQFPLLLYQITSKFRDEIKPRFGLMRGREFIMKDMYSFDINEDCAKTTYEIVNESYEKILKKIGLNYVKVLGSSGSIGGSLSHEYHLKSDIGEDKLLSCSKCDYSANIDLSGKDSCQNCNSTDVALTSGIEIAHTFLLGDKYSKPLKAKYLNKNGKPELLQMGCYGIGVSRLLSASVEVLSTESEMRWPDIIAPFNVLIIPPKSGSNEETLTKDLAEKLYDSIEEIPNFENNVLIDDRTSYTIGRRFLDGKRVGYRYVIVIGKKSTEATSLFELNDLKQEKQMYLSTNELLTYLKENTIL